MIERRVSVFKPSDRTDKEWNLLRAQILVRDEIEGFKTIQIKLGTAEALNDMSLEQTDTDTYDGRIMLLIKSFHELAKINENLGLNEIEEGD
jgi:hypothetical protein